MFFPNSKKRLGSYPTFHVKKGRSFAANSAVVLQDLKSYIILTPLNLPWKKRVEIVAVKYMYFTSHAKGREN